MKIYDIVCAKGQNKKPCAHLFYNEESDAMQIAIEPWATSRDVPMLFESFLEAREIPDAWARAWVEMRTVPTGRQNLGEILRAQNLERYDLIALMEKSKGRSANDDFLVLRSECSSAPIELVTSDKKDSGETGYSHSQETEPIFTFFQGSSPFFYATIEIGKELKNARIQAGLSQNELSEATGIQQAMISKIEKGKANPTVGTLATLARGLGKTLHIGLE